MNPPLTETELTNFELRHQITLPLDYREFLLGKGNGGDLFFKLGETDDGWGFSLWEENDGFVGVLAKPFPYTEPWNDLTGYIEHTGEESEEADRAYDEMREVFDKRYYQPIDGALPLAHLGCAIRLWLVVSGIERGHVWYDDRANLEGLRPLLTREGKRVNFLEWYNSEEGDA
jgi:hypothetical protein